MLANRIFIHIMENIQSLPNDVEFRSYVSEAENYGITERQGVTRCYRWDSCL